MSSTNNLTLNGRDITIERAVTNFSGVWELIEGISAITEPNKTHIEEDYPSYDSSNGTATHVSGIDEGEYQVELNFNPIQYPIHRTLKEDCYEICHTQFRAIYTDTGEAEVFVARVSSWQSASPPQGRKTATFTMKILTEYPVTSTYVTN